MYDELTEKIKEYVISKQQRPIPFDRATPKDVEDAEASLGFPIPGVLKALYLAVGNGGFGPGQGGKLIGVKGGYASSPGTLVEQYEDIRRGAEYFGLAWRPGLLPFCEWGCTMFSCVDCKAPDLHIYLCEACRAKPMQYGLDDFAKMWIEGVDILSQGNTCVEQAEIVNPFSGKKTKARSSLRD